VAAVPVPVIIAVTARRGEGQQTPTAPLSSGEE